MKPIPITRALTDSNLLGAALGERRTHRSGKDTVDHGRSGSDDLANALCGCAVNTISPKSSYDLYGLVRGGDPPQKHPPGSTYRVGVVTYARIGVRPLWMHPSIFGRYR
jgi:hypothetical protein